MRLIIAQKQLLALLVFPFIFFGCKSTNVEAENERIADHRILQVFDTVRDSNSGEFVRLIVPQVVFQDQKGLYWVGTLTDLYTYDDKTGIRKTIPGVNSADLHGGIEVICGTPDGEVWFRSMLDKSLHVYDGKSCNKVESIQSLEIGGYPRAMFNGLNRLWIALSKGVFSYDRQHWSSPLEPSPDIQRAYTILPAKYHNNLSIELSMLKKRWENTRKAYKQIDEQQNNSLSITAEISVGIEDRQELLWFGTRRAILRYAIKDKEWRIYSLPEGIGEVFHLYEDRTGRIWFADSKGMVGVHDKRENTWSYYKPEDHFPNNPGSILPKFQITAIFQCKNLQMMIATTRGLVIFSESEKKWQTLTTQNSKLPDNHITLIKEDKDDRIWLGTGKALLILDQ
jgi:ligand-binding sensor domain-containing protein